MGVHTFPKGICLKVNVIVHLEFELMYYDSAVQHFNYHTMGTPPYMSSNSSRTITFTFIPWERYEPLYPPIYGLNSTTTVLLLKKNDGFVIKQPKEVDMPLNNKQTYLSKDYIDTKSVVFTDCQFLAN